MAKNSALISALAENARLRADLARARAAANVKFEDVIKETEDVCPKVYAAILYVLKKQYHFGQHELVDVLNSSYDVWQKVINKEENMLEWVEKETGIRMEFGGYEE